MQRRQRTRGLLGAATAAVLLAMTLGLAGCGSDGDDGAQGPPGDPGTPGAPGAPGTPGAPADPTQDPLSLAATHQLPVPMYAEATIDQVRVIDGSKFVEVTFTVDGYTGDSIDVELTLAKWLPEDGTWINMLQRAVGPGDGTTVVRAGNLRLAQADSGSSPVTGGMNGQFTTLIRSPNADYAGPGPIDFSDGIVWRRAGEDQASTYCGTDAAYCAYVQSILDGIAAAGTGWDSNAIYRVGVTSRNNAAARFNAIGYVTGNGVPATDPNPVMTKASCSGCHGERVVLNVHGNQRHEPELCSSCHNDFTFDADNSQAATGGWTNINAALMVHKIHAGIEGYMVADRSYQDVRFPDWLFGRNAGPKNCTTCHEDVRPVEQAHWNEFPTTRACLSCHEGDSVVQAFPGAPAGVAAHTTPASQLDPQACTQCHGTGPDSLAVARTADEFHGVTAALAVLDEREDYRLKIVSVTDAVAGQQPQIAWQVVDGDGTPYPSVSALNPQQLLVGIGWGYGDDWVNDGVELRANGARGDPWRIVSDANTAFDGATATTTLPALPTAATAGRNGYAAIYLVEDPDAGPPVAGLNVNGSVIKPNTAIATLTLSPGSVENPANDRRQIVSAEGCNSCHTTTFRHGTFANDDITGCVACHNAGSLSRDDSEVQGSVDFMFMVHAIHSIGDGNRERFDRRRDHGYTDRSQVSTILACQSCHLPGTYAFPVDRNARIGVIADNTKAPSVTWDGTGVNSAEASVCFSCHESGVSLDADPIKAHMATFGATMDGVGTHADLLGEVSACTGCHTPAN
jgi:OmcA/MtrC family decaheme c-type cytochrome